MKQRISLGKFESHQVAETLGIKLLISKYFKNWMKIHNPKEGFIYKTDFKVEGSWVFLETNVPDGIVYNKNIGTFEKVGE